MNRSSAQQAELLSYLSLPASYPDRTDSVVVKETHISWVFLTDRYAYKLKKAVTFPFLDFSNLTLRQRACRDEVSLNRRLSPTVYLDVLSINRSKSGKFEFDSTGEVVDWLVRMRRLDESKTLENRIGRDELTGRELESIAELLCGFFVEQPPVLMKAEQYVHALSTHIQSNEADLIRLSRDDQEIKFLHAAQRRFLLTESSEFAQRVCDGRIIDGHGDLRPEHIFLESKPAIIDCVEFNHEYRHNDIADELAFLAMECDRLGRRDIGPTILNRYRRDSKDDVSMPMFAFYKAYRACVRAKVAMLRDAQSDNYGIGKKQQPHSQYLDLARQYISRFSPLALITIGGKMGSGKSTLAETLADRMQATLVQSDVIRPKYQSVNGPSGFAQGKYSDESRRQVYEKMFAAVPGLFAANPTVILDATFSTQQSREDVIALARDYGVETMHFECECPDAVAIQRIAQRSEQGQSSSEARVEHFHEFCERYEPPDSACERIDTESSLADQITTVMNWLSEITHAGEACRIS